MRRRLITVLSPLSLLLCVAVCWLWARSINHFDHVTWRHAVRVTPAEREERSLRVLSVRGRLFFGRSRETYTPFPPWEGWRDPHPRPGVAWTTSLPRPGWMVFEQNVLDSFDQYREWRLPGTGVVRIATITNHGGPRLRFDAVGVPHGAVALALALPPAWAAAKWWRRRRAARAGLCRRCGYDLRGTPDRCPECGAPGDADGTRQSPRPSA